MNYDKNVKGEAEEYRIFFTQGCKLIWYLSSITNCISCDISQNSYLLIIQNNIANLHSKFPEFAVVHTIRGFGIVNKADVNIFQELSCFFGDPMDVVNLISGSSAFSKTSLNI